MYPFRSSDRGHFVAAENAGRCLTATYHSVGEWERFDIIDVGGGCCAIRPHAGYLSAVHGCEGHVEANRSATGD
jgi:hypothetical protein